MSSEILHHRIVQQFNSLFVTPPEVPDYLQVNLSHKLRPYQEEAIRHFIFTQETDKADLSFNHTLFHMATGSGKTLVLAATILYLFKEKGHQNFVFFVNSDAIIRKTYDNLTNRNSNKYLFNPDGIVIDGNIITLQVVDVFPSFPANNTIYLKLTTIQKLHMDLTIPRENGLTYELLSEMSLVLLGDEAHHINAYTRSDKRKLNTKELEEKTWENTVFRLLKQNSSNRLIEYTATIELTNDSLYHKYRDKIVFQYDLKRFMEDGYSKNVVLLRANEDDSNKMLYGMLLSQYRKYVANDHGISMKPIILFKSNKIAVSLNANQHFLEIINGLNVDKLKKTISEGIMIYQNVNSIWHKMFNYYGQMDLEKVIRDLQWDFTSETILNANNNSFLSEGNALLLNTLEDINNPIRAIFAVAKLNEGWDVLNLFDIVRISEGATHTKTTTDSEAQLIGRGARYYPFKHEEIRSYTRRYDFSDTSLKLIETLHYHTINESAYIKNLQKSLDVANIQLKEDEYNRLEAKVKPKIRRMDFFRNGKIYINRLIATTAENYQSFQDYNIQHVYEASFETAIEQHYGTSNLTTTSVKYHEEELKISKTILQKALHRNKFYHFSNLKNYVPSISSMKNFIEDDAFLGSLKIIVRLPEGLTVDNLSPKDKLSLVQKFLTYAEKNIRANYMKERGTPIFEGIAMSHMIDDYVVEMNKVNPSAPVTQIIRQRSMREHDWYIYDNAIVNGLESNFIDFINDYIEKLRELYSDVYLIRNERKIKIVEIDGVRGFMPDFLLYMKNQNFTYQVFLEPKGDNLHIKDKWKEDFLLSLSNNENIEVLTENEDVRLIGLKFYSSDKQMKNEFREDFTQKLLEN